ncbi:MAG TPA: hypothetical protein VES68_00240 [Candidatus Sulfotelmatobacter sp.]|nr:hypothetical protein [Candidatus Sulfotelmatobacter sp.]
MFGKFYESFWNTAIPFIKKYYVWFARLSFFIIYFWFGILKIFDTSPANPLVYALQQKTLPFLSFSQFIIFFSLYEMLIGILFLIPKLTRLTFILFILHMVTTVMPLFLLPQFSWQGFLTPTLEGQYMIKNLILIALASSILVNTKEVR